MIKGNITIIKLHTNRRETLALGVSAEAMLSAEIVFIYMY
jgi:hypothetical protein